MKKSGKVIKRIGGKTISIEELETYPEEPSRKDIINHLLSHLQDANQHFEKRYLKFDKKLVPRDFLDLFLGLKDEVNFFLENIDGIFTATKSGKSIGRNKTIEAMKIAADVLVEYQHFNKDKSAIPTGRYFFEEVNARINDMALRGETCPMNISLRTAQLWAKSMRDGNFLSKA